MGNKHSKNGIIILVVLFIHQENGKKGFPLPFSLLVEPGTQAWWNLDLLGEDCSWLCPE